MRVPDVKKLSEKRGLVFLFRQCFIISDPYYRFPCTLEVS
jgi:hypothetical protein